MKSYNEVLVGLFTVQDGSLEILFLKKNNDPYAGYWILPSNIVKKDNFEQEANNIILEKIGLENIKVYQSYTFSDLDRYPDKRVIATSYFGLVDSKTIDLKMIDTKYEKKWFKINEIPKMGFDHSIITNKLINDLRKLLLDQKLIVKFFPSDFTLGELQLFFESLEGKKLDRRNFRKRILNLDMIEKTGDKSDNKVGRPATLYKFKD